MSIDRTPPITTSNIVSGNWNRIASVTCRLSAIDFAETIHDTPSGIDKTFYTKDGSEPSSVHYDGVGPTDIPNGATEFDISGQGVFTIKYYSVDNNGNTEYTKTDFLKLDNVAPVSSQTPSFLADGSNGWYKNTPTITLSSIDVASNVDKIYYKWNSDSWHVYVAPIVLPSIGIHTLYFYAVDNAGNAEDVKIAFYKLDDQAPLTQDNSPEGLQKLPVTVQFFSSDDVSGTANTYYTTDGTTPTINSTSGSSLNLANSGNYTIKYFSVDFAGNQEIVRTSNVQVSIDTEAPRTYVSESFPINGTNGWYRTSPYISLTSEDNSGIKEIKYKLNPVGQTTTAKYTSTVDLSGTINLTTNFNIALEIDKSGIRFDISLRGATPQQTTTIEIIDTINTIVGQIIAFETDENGLTGFGYVTLISPTASSGDSNSEIKFVQPISNDATQIVFGLDTTYPHTFTEIVLFVLYTTPFMLPFNGNWLLTYYATDNMGNQGVDASKQYQLDSNSAITICIPSFLPDGNNNWYNTNPEISLRALDLRSGVFKTYFQWDNSFFIEYVSGTTTTIPEQGVHTLKFYSIDLAGNIEIVNERQFKFDNTVPVTTDNTLEFQGVIFTNSGSGYKQVIEENSQVIGTKLQTDNVNVIAVTNIFNLTKNQEYYALSITGTEHNEISVAPYNTNENSTRIGNYQINLLQYPIVSFNAVKRIYNFTNGVEYSIDVSNSDLNTGNLNLINNGAPILLGDELQVNYYFQGLPLSPNDVVHVTYFFDNSHKQQVLNSLNYVLSHPIVQPFVHDIDIEILLSAHDDISTVVQTFYTIDGSTPTISSSQGTTIRLSDNGIYTIKYFSIDAAGNIESVKTAQYVIAIDKNLPYLHDLIIVKDVLDDGEHGWYKKNFQLKVNIDSSDIIANIDKQVIKQTNHRILNDVNDVIDFKEGLLTLFVKIPAGLYSSSLLAIQIQNSFLTAGCLIKPKMSL